MIRYVALGRIDRWVTAFPGFPRELAIRLEHAWQEQQQQLLPLSSQSRQMVAHHSGHYLQLEEPELVVNAIRSVVELARRSA